MIETTTAPNGATRTTATRRYSLSLDEVLALRDQGNIIPIYREIMADLETPVSAYLKVAEGPHSFLLESVEGGTTLARYSFLGSDPYLVVRLEDGIANVNQGGYKQSVPYEDPLVALQQFLAPYRAVHVEGLPRFLGGAVGGIERRPHRAGRHRVHADAAFEQVRRQRPGEGVHRALGGGVVEQLLAAE